MDRLTGGTGHIQPPPFLNQRPSPLVGPTSQGLRNESYYMATNETWSPLGLVNGGGNNSVLIEEDPEPVSP